MKPTSLSASRGRVPRFKRAQLIRLDRLLHMRYTPAELAREIGVSVDTVYRSYIPAGCPQEPRGGGRYWIVGSEFRDWAWAWQKFGMAI